MWYKYMHGIALVLAGIITMTMRVVNGADIYADFTYSPLTYVIGALLIIAGGFSIYTAYKEDNHAN